MRIHKGAVVLQPGAHYIDQLKQLIPHAAVGAIDQEPAIAFKHKLVETMLARNVGFDIPSPIAYGWKYPGMYPPRDNQLHTSSFATLHRRGFILNDMRTGKTASALWAAEYLMQEGLIDRVLIHCPKSCMRAVWEQALFECLPHRACAVLHGSKERRLDNLALGTPFCIINHDGPVVLSTKVRPKGRGAPKIECMLKGLFTLHIFDEADVLCNHKTNMYKAFVSCIQADTWIWLMTGTPIPNKYSDAWGLIRLINPRLPVSSWTQFRELTMEKITQFKYRNRPGARDILNDLMQPAIRFTKEQCFDLPAVIEMWREAELSTQQKKLYKEMQTLGRLERDQSEAKVTAANAAVKLAKLLQISAGAVRDEFGNKVPIDSTPRLVVLEQILHECGVRECDSGTCESKKAVVFMPFKYIMEDMHEWFKARGIRTKVINGDTPDWKRRELLAEFKSDYTGPVTCEVLLAHPEVMAHGVDLTAAEAIIWYAPCYGARLYQQGNERHQGAKQKGQPVIIHMTATRLERERFKALRDATRTQDDFLATYERALQEDLTDL